MAGGKFLLRGNPDKKILKCTENSVGKGKSYANGWEDKIISECQLITTSMKLAILT